MSMRRSNVWQNTIRLAVFAGLIGMMLSCGNGYQGKIIAVELDGEPGNFEGASLVLLDPDKSESGTSILIGDFSSTASPSLSHEGRNLYFQGKE